ncbi:multiprotein-bridging factor 1 family protein [Streptomyces sp. NPDC059919]|uniref:helix-turn-helix domain-containing protein n=1 Tax=Streptomyces sp. NPDC059919 TaxID=3347004 RepID=UPI0036665352
MPRSAAPARTVEGDDVEGDDVDGDGSQTPRSAARPDPTTIRSKAHLGRELTALREAARWSLRDLGRACEVPFGTLGGWLRGANLPQPGQIDAFDEVLSLCGIRSPAERNLWIATVARLRREGVPGERDGAGPGHGEGHVPTTSRSSAIREGSYAGTRIRGGGGGGPKPPPPPVDGNPGPHASERRGGAGGRGVAAPAPARPVGAGFASPPGVWAPPRPPPPPPPPGPPRPPPHGSAWPRRARRTRPSARSGCCATAAARPPSRDGVPV